MMSRLVSSALVASLVLVLAACSSAPIRFYTLVPPPTAQRAASAPYAIAVLPVTIPAQVDRPELVVREGDSRVALLEGQRWIAPLGDEIRSALSADLTRALGAEDVYGVGNPKGVPVYRVKVDIRRFESVPAQYTMLVATWTVSGAGGNGRVAPCTVRLKEPVGQGYAALAEGHQRGLRALAARIAQAIGAAAQGHAAGCHATSR